MKTRTIFLSLVLITYSFISYSQSPEKGLKPPFYKNRVGIQLNPCLNKNEIFTDFVFGLRYGYNISKPVILGAEISESIPAFGRFTGVYSQYNDFKIGMFARYLFFPEKRIQGFIEGSPFYSHRYFKGLETLSGNVPKNILGLYIAPGVSIFTKNRKFSMDLYYQIYIHPTSFYYYHKNVISYKLNFHF
jgi:hypothetical protein